MHLSEIGERASGEARTRAKKLDREQPDWFWEADPADLAGGAGDIYSVALHGGFAYQIEIRRDVAENIERLKARGFELPEERFMD